MCARPAGQTNNRLITSHKNYNIISLKSVATPVAKQCYWHCSSVIGLTVGHCSDTDATVCRSMFLRHVKTLSFYWKCGLVNLWPLYTSGIGINVM